MTITNVFKLEHPFMLKRFQKASSSLAGEGGKVKGLFCSLPAQCVPRVAAFGTHAEADARTVHTPTILTLLGLCTHERRLLACYPSALALLCVRVCVCVCG
jgi:hypothetical protein